RRLEQVLKNLLANAFKFTDSGWVQFRVEMASPGKQFESESLNAAGQVVGLSVVDTGIGIPKNKQKLIFEAFQQADGSTSRKYGGTGLGLSISREIASALGGEIQVESSPGKGSRFTLYLPVRYRHAVPSNITRPEMESESGQLGEGAQSLSALALQLAQAGSQSTGVGELPCSLAGKKVLIVDDDLRNLFAVTSLLEAQGMKVLCAENGRAGIEMIERHPDIDIVLMDIMMPEMDGYETMKLIRKDPTKDRLPVIAVTAKALKEDRERCMNAGASDYLAKPINEAQLIDLIGIWTGGSQTQVI
ncbi:MAG TPA: response regulator, partial [Candidatus Binataceae bacterium]|nr:response regulator [Candidatus Binataceae bacterium]